MTQLALEFSGRTYDPAKDGQRLRKQLGRVYETLSWRRRFWTLAEIRSYHSQSWDVNDSEASISARLRDLRKPRYGSHTIERRRRAGANGLHEYRMVQGAKS